MSVMLALIVKTAVPLACALIVARLLARQSAALRHAVVAAGVVSALLVPAAQWVAPAWTLPAMSGRTAVTAPPSATAAGTAERDDVSAQESVVVTAIRPSADRGRVSISATRIVLSLWACGSALALLLLAVGLGRLWRINAGCRAVANRRWLDAATSVARRYGIGGRIALRESESARVLLAFGWWRPAIVVPPGADAWTNARIRMVLAHELAHVSRGDWLVQLVAELLRAMLWFNPLAWMAVRSLRTESERACDDLVLETGVDAVEYADALAALARELRPIHDRWIPAPAMARASSLEGRVSAMFDATVTRTAPRRRVRAAVFATVAAIGLMTAGYGVSAQSFSTVRGLVQDPHGGSISGVVVSLSSQTGGQKYEVKTDLTGHYEFVGVVAGEYQVQFVRAGFRTIQQPLTVSARAVTQNASMLIGQLEETLSVGRTTGEADPLAAEKASQVMTSELARFEREAAACVAPPAGGALNPPTKIKDVRPVYPTGGSAQGETVEYTAVIAMDGTVREVSLASQSATPELASSGEAAIRQWRFTPTLLNCVPVEVEMRVHVRFQAQ